MFREAIRLSRHDEERKLQDQYVPEQTDSADVPEEEVLGGSDGMFTPARPLDFFRDGIDKQIFRWYNRDHVQAGKLTCGELYPPLGPDRNEPFPKIIVKFCVLFAEIQPAGKGNLAIHCGGPSSLSECLSAANMFLGAQNLQHYNVIAFDQVRISC